MGCLVIEMLIFSLSFLLFFQGTSPLVLTQDLGGILGKRMKQVPIPLPGPALYFAREKCTSFYSKSVPGPGFFSRSPYESALEQRRPLLPTRKGSRTWVHFFFIYLFHENHHLCFSWKRVERFHSGNTACFPGLAFLGSRFLAILEISPEGHRSSL